MIECVKSTYKDFVCLGKVGESVTKCFIFLVNCIQKVLLLRNQIPINLEFIFLYNEAQDSSNNFIHDW